MTALGLSPISEPDWPSWWPRSSTGAWKAPDIGNGTNLIALGNTSDVLTGSWVEGGPGDPALDGTHDLGWFSRVALWEVTGIPSPTPTGDVPISFDVTLAWSSPVGPIWGECGIQLIGDQQFAPLGTTIPVNQGRAKSVWPPMTANTTEPPTNGITTAVWELGIAQRSTGRPHRARSHPARPTPITPTTG